MGRRPTIIDVASKAGVSKSTVSLVLQNSPLVRESTREAVRDAMAEIGYVYNRAAANMRGANAGLIGLVINDLRNPFFTEFATSLQMALSGRGYATVIANTDEDPALQTQVVDAMIEHGVSALIMSPAYGQQETTFDRIAQAGIPTMQVLRKVDQRIDLFPFAAPDYVAGSHLATRHLLDLSCKQVAFVGGLEARGVTRERMSGYHTELSNAGIQPLSFTGQASRSFGTEAALLLARDYPQIDAALCFNDLVALGMLAGCAQINRKVGKDFRIVSFDDIRECSEVYPGLTSVHCEIAGFGERMATTLLNWLEHGITPDPEFRTEVKLNIRQSTQGPSN
ncbi:MAG: LacI family DNA-binding transcriptional regulator [Rhizobiaceae bacterium]